MAKTKAVVYLDANTAKFRSKMKMAGSVMRKQSAVIRNAWRPIGRVVRNTTLAITGLGIAAVAMTAKVDAGIAEIGTLMGGLTNGEIKEMRQELQDVSEITGQAMNKLIKARYDIVSAGFRDAADSAEVLNTSARLAVAGVSDVATAADIVTTSLNAYGLTAKHAGDVSDILFKTVQLGKTTLTQLSGTLGAAIPFAAELGIGLDELGASVATLTAGGQNTARAVTAIRAAMAQMMKPSTDLQSVLDGLGSDFRELIAQKGLVETFSLIAKQADIMGLNIGNAFGNVRAMQAVLPLTGKSALSFANAMAEMGTRTGIADKAFAQIQKRIDTQIKIVWRKLQGILYTIGEELIPIVQGRIEQLSVALTASKDKIKIVAERFADMAKWLLDLGASLLPDMIKGVKSVGNALVKNSEKIKSFLAILMKLGAFAVKHANIIATIFVLSVIVKTGVALIKMGGAIKSVTVFLTTLSAPKMLAGLTAVHGKLLLIGGLGAAIAFTATQLYRLYKAIKEFGKAKDALDVSEKISSAVDDKLRTVSKEVFGKHKEEFEKLGITFEESVNNWTISTAEAGIQIISIADAMKIVDALSSDVAKNLSDAAKSAGDLGSQLVVPADISQKTELPELTPMMSIPGPRVPELDYVGEVSLDTSRAESELQTFSQDFDLVGAGMVSAGRNAIEQIASSMKDGTFKMSSLFSAFGEGVKQEMQGIFRELLKGNNVIFKNSSKIFGAIGDKIGSISKSVFSFAKTIVSGFGSAVGKIAGFIGQIVGKYGKIIIESLISFGAQLLSFYSFLGPFAPIAAAGTVVAGFKLIKGMVSGISFERGGIARGGQEVKIPGTTDNMMAAVTAGEAIVPVKYVQKYGEENWSRFIQSGNISELQGYKSVGIAGQQEVRVPNTTDNMMTTVTEGEAIVPVRHVQRYGEENWSRFIQSGNISELQGYESGGVVGQKETTVFNAPVKNSSTASEQQQNNTYVIEFKPSVQALDSKDVERYFKSEGNRALRNVIQSLIDKKQVQ